MKWKVEYADEQAKAKPQSRGSSNSRREVYLPSSEASKDSRVKVGLFVFALVMACGALWMGVSDVAGHGGGGGGETRAVNDTDTNPPTGSWCRPASLRPYFGTNAEEMSCIMSKENSQCDPQVESAVDRRSIGLLQINLYGRTERRFVDESDSRAAVQLGKLLEKEGVENCADGSEKLLDGCETVLKIPERNLEYAAWLFNASGWSPWKTAAQMCGLR